MIAKYSHRLIAFLALACLAGCITIAEPANDPFAYLDDPVARAESMRWSWEPRQHFDAGIVLRRYRFSNSAQDGGTADMRMAFDVNSNPVQVGIASLNGVTLPWIPTEKGLFKSQIYGHDNDTSGYGTPDSADFSFAGYDGETWTATVDVTPDFGQITSPDTVTISQGWTIRYQNAVPGDSIMVGITAPLSKSEVDTLPPRSWYIQETLPDTGTIVIPPAKLPHVAGIDSYILQVYRFRFTERTSPHGKVIGIYSEENFPPYDYPAKP